MANRLYLLLGLALTLSCAARETPAAFTLVSDWDLQVTSPEALAATSNHSRLLPLS